MRFYLIAIRRAVTNATCLLSQPLEIQAYRDLSLDELAERTEEAKHKLGDRVIVLGHNYQRDEVIRHAGEHGGITCTSSNARRVIEWAWARREKILFFPDEHLGRNTANKMGIPREEMVVWDPFLPAGGNAPEAIKKARILLWKGHCSVHQMFQPAHVRYFREKHSSIKIIVHPECHEDVVNLADSCGSTEFIIRTVSAGEPGSIWGVGTELNLVNRLKRRQPDKQVYFLSPTVCQCATMFRIDAPHLCWAMENLAEGHVVNQISVPDDDKHWARIALQRMLDVSVPA